MRCICQCFFGALLLAILSSGLAVAQGMKVSKNRFDLIVQTDMTITEVTIRLNPEGTLFKTSFDYEAGKLPPGEHRIPLLKFLKPDGQRFNPDTHDVKEVWVTDRTGLSKVFTFRNR